MTNGRSSLADYGLAAGPVNLSKPAAPRQILLPLGELAQEFGQAVNSGTPKVKPKPVTLRLRGRCVEKGCVFPAVSGPEGKCLHHQRQQYEPGLYSSHQPSSALVGRGKFGPARTEEVGPAVSRRGLDRRRLMAERERFLNEQV